MLCGKMLYQGSLLAKDKKTVNYIFLCRNDALDRILEYHIGRDMLYPGFYPHEGSLMVKFPDRFPEPHIFQKFDYKYRDEALKRAGI